MQTTEERAQRAYQAYGETTHFRNYQGNPMPWWDELGPAIQHAWMAAADALTEPVKEPTVQKPSPCRMVMATVDPTMNNGSDEAPAVITRVWGEHPDGGWTVNLRVFVDTPAAPLSLTSVRLFDEPSVAENRPGTAWWPPRV